MEWIHDVFFMKRFHDSSMREWKRIKDREDGLIYLNRPGISVMGDIYRWFGFCSRFH
jgi:hypothetical protein